MVIKYIKNIYIYTCGENILFESDMWKNKIFLFTWSRLIRPFVRTPEVSLLTITYLSQFPCTNTKNLRNAPSNVWPIDHVYIQTEKRSCENFLVCCSYHSNAIRSNMPLCDLAFIPKQNLMQICSYFSLAWIKFAVSDQLTSSLDFHTAITCTKTWLCYFYLDGQVLCLEWVRIFKYGSNDCALITDVSFTITFSPSSFLQLFLHSLLKKTLILLYSTLQNVHSYV